jgi:GMP synthase-like glutamine amidotransferase
MRLLIIDNDGTSLEELKDICTHSGYLITTVRHTDITPGIADGYDLVVLSSGYWYSDEAKQKAAYDAELELIRSTTVPVFGICIGMLLLHAAEGQPLPQLDIPASGFRDITLTPEGQQLTGLPAQLTVYEDHTRYVPEPSPNFVALATSPGYVEIMMHRTKPQLGVQFHPEIGEQAEALFAQLANTLLQRAKNSRLDTKPLEDQPVQQ